MQIVIDIDENVFTRLFDNGIEDYAIVNDDLFTIAKSIRNCIPLPKGHGALKDADKMLETWYDNFCAFMTQTELDSMNNIIKNAPTIIEADTAESEG